MPQQQGWRLPQEPKKKNPWSGHLRRLPLPSLSPDGPHLSSSLSHFPDWNQALNGCSGSMWYRSAATWSSRISVMTLYSWAERERHEEPEWGSSKVFAGLRMGTGDRCWVSDTWRPPNLQTHPVPTCSQR